MFNKTIQDIPADRWFERPGDGCDHLLWIVGHIAAHRGMALKTLGVEWSAPWQDLFAEGAPRVAAEKYPKADVILREFDKISDQLPAALEGASGELLILLRRPTSQRWTGSWVAWSSYWCGMKAITLGKPPT